MEPTGSRPGLHGLSASPWQRLALWWAPPAEAKIISGPSRNALWLGAGQLAVTGYDGSAKGHHLEIPSGLELIDTRTWTVRQVDRHSSSAVLAAGRLLAFGTAFGTGPDGANQGFGLTCTGRVTASRCIGSGPSRSAGSRSTATSPMSS